MKLSEFMIKAQANIADESKWTQGCMAVNASGVEVSTDSDSATCFCSLGALYKAELDIRMDNPKDDFLINNLLYKATSSLSKFTGDRSIASFNDSHTHSEVMAAWDKAIVTAQLKETNP